MSTGESFRKDFTQNAARMGIRQVDQKEKIAQTKEQRVERAIFTELLSPWVQIKCKDRYWEVSLINLAGARKLRMLLSMLSILIL